MSDYVIHSILASRQTELPLGYETKIPRQLRLVATRDDVEGEDVNIQDSFKLAEVFHAIEHTFPSRESATKPPFRITRGGVPTKLPEIDSSMNRTLSPARTSYVTLVDSVLDIKSVNRRVAGLKKMVEAERSRTVSPKVSPVKHVPHYVKIAVKAKQVAQVHIAHMYSKGDDKRRTRKMRMRFHQDKQDLLEEERQARKELLALFAMERAELTVMKNGERDTVKEINTVRETRELIAAHEQKMVEDRQKFAKQFLDKVVQERKQASSDELEIRMRLMQSETKVHERYIVQHEENFKKAKRQEMMRLQVQKAEQARLEREDRKQLIQDLKEAIEVLPQDELHHRTGIEGEHFGSFPWLREKYKESYIHAIHRTLEHLEEDASEGAMRRASSLSSMSTASPMSSPKIAAHKRLSQGSSDEHRSISARARVSLKGRSPREVLSMIQGQPSVEPRITPSPAKFSPLQTISPTRKIDSPDDAPLTQSVVEIVPGMCVSVSSPEEDTVALQAMLVHLESLKELRDTDKVVNVVNAVFQSENLYTTVGSSEPLSCFKNMTWIVGTAPRCPWTAIILALRPLPFTSEVYATSQPMSSHIDCLLASVAPTTDAYKETIETYPYLDILSLYGRPLWNPTSLALGALIPGAVAAIDVRVVGGGDDKHEFWLKDQICGNNISIQTPLRSLSDLAVVCNQISFVPKSRGDFLIELVTHCTGIPKVVRCVKVTVHPPLFSLTESHIESTQPIVDIGATCIIRRKDIQSIAMSTAVRRFMITVECDTLATCDDIVITGYGLNWDTQSPMDDGTRCGILFHENKIIALTRSSGREIVFTLFEHGRSVLENVFTLFKSLLLRMDASYAAPRALSIRMTLPMPKFTVMTSQDIRIVMKVAPDYPHFVNFPRSIYYHGQDGQKIFSALSVLGTLPSPCEFSVTLLNSDIRCDRLVLPNTAQLAVTTTSSGHNSILYRLQPTRCRIGVLTSRPQFIGITFEPGAMLRANVELVLHHIIFITESTVHFDRIVDVNINDGPRGRSTLLVYPPLLEKNFIAKVSKTPALYIQKGQGFRFMTEDGQCAIIDLSRVSQHRPESIPSVIVTFDDPQQVVSFEVEPGFGLKIVKEQIRINGIERGSLKIKQCQCVIQLFPESSTAHLRRDLALVLRHTRMTGLQVGFTKALIKVEDHNGNVETAEAFVVVYEGAPGPYFAVETTERRYRQQSRKATEGFDILVDPVIFHPEYEILTRASIFVELVGGGFADGEDILGFVSVQSPAGDVFELALDGVLTLTRCGRDSEGIGTVDFPSTNSMKISLNGTMTVHDIEVVLRSITFQNDEAKVKQGVRSYSIKVSHAPVTPDTFQPIGKVKVNIAVSGPLLWAPPYAASLKFQAPGATLAINSSQAPSSIPINSKVVVNTVEGDYIFGTVYVEISSGYSWDTNEDLLLLRLNTNELELTKDNEVWSLHSNHRSFIAKVIAEDNKLLFSIDRTRSKLTGKLLQILFRSVHYDNIVCSHNSDPRVVEFVILEDNADISELCAVQTVITIISKTEPTAIDIPDLSLSYVLTQLQNGIRLAEGATVSTSADMIAFNVQSFFRVELLSQPSPTDALTLLPPPGSPLQIFEDGVVTWHGRDVAQIVRGKTEGGLGKHKFQLSFVGAPFAAVEAIVRSVVFFSSAKKDRFPVKKIQLSLRAGQNVSTTRVVVTVTLHELLIDTFQSVIKQPAGTKVIIPFTQFLKINPSLSYSEASISLHFCHTASGGIVPHNPSDGDVLFFQSQDKNIKVSRAEILLDKAVIARINDGGTPHSTSLTFVKGKVSEKNALSVIKSWCLETSSPSGKSFALRVSVSVPLAGHSEVVTYTVLT